MNSLFDINWLLEGGDLIPAIINSNLPHLGALDPRQTVKDLPKKAELQLPLYLVE